jgi:hypothetical protein
MRTVPFRSVLDDVLGAAGYAYDASNTTLIDRAVQNINTHVARIHEAAPWMEAIRCQERAFAAPWHASLAYSSGDVVWSPTLETYYEAAQDVPAGTVVTNATYWTETTRPTESLIEWEQYGLDEIGRVWKAQNRDYFGDTKPRSYGWMERDDGLMVKDCSADTAWILFNTRPTRFSGKAWSAGVVYPRKSIVLSPSSETTGVFPQQGECFRYEVDADGNNIWVYQPFPARFELYVKAAASADLMRYAGKPNESVALTRGEADRYFEEEVQKAGAGSEIEVGG